MRNSLALGLTAITLVSGCGSTPTHSGPTPGPDVSHRYVQVEHDDGRRATLDPGTRRNARVLHVVSVVPAPAGGVTPQAIRFAFTALTSEKELLLPNGKRTPHPDLAVLEAAERELQGNEADVDTIVLARLHDLIALDSRAQLLSRVASLPMSAAKLEALVETVATPSVLSAPGPEGLVGGDAGEAVSALLPLLAARDDLSASQASRLLASLPQASHYNARARTLTSLLGGGHVGVDQALPVAPLLAQDDRFALLKRLAAGELTPDQAGRVLNAGLAQRSYAPRDAILNLLMPEARQLLTLDQCLAACSKLSEDSKYRTLTRLAKRKSLTPAAAKAIVASAVQQRDYARRQGIVELLAPASRGLLSVSELTAASRHLTSDARYRVLTRAAKTPELSPSDALVLASVARKLRDYRRRAELLGILSVAKRKLLTVSQIVNASASLSSDGRFRALVDLAKRPDLTAKQAALVLEPALKQRDYARRSEVLALLAPAKRKLLSVRQITEATASLSSSDRQRTLIGVAKRRPLAEEDAHLLANTAPKIRDYGARRTLLVSLVGAADDEVLTAAAKSLDSKGETAVLRALLKHQKSR